MNFHVTPDNYLQFLKFVTHRKDAHALQGAHGRYRKVLAPIRDGDYIKHLKGEMTLGTYQILDNCVRWACWDVDGHEGKRDVPIQIVKDRVLGLTSVLRQRDIPHLLAESSIGSYHVWLFFDPPAPAFKAYHFMREIGGNEIETFPKQDRVGKDGYGNLVRLPLGIHRMKRERYHYIDDEFHPIAEFRVQTLDISEYEPKVKGMKPAAEALKDDEPTRMIPSTTTPGGIPPCMEQSLAGGVQFTGSGGHYFRLAIVSVYRKVGLSFAAICKLFSKQEDYSEEITKKQVHSVLKREDGYSFSCNTLRAKCGKFVLPHCKNCRYGGRHHD